MNDRKKRIEELIRVYGADVERWPKTEGLGLPDFVNGLAAARDEERRLDGLLESAQPPAPSAALYARIAAIPRRSRGPVFAGMPFFGGFWRPAGVAAAALVVGLFLGQLNALRPAQVVALDAESAGLFADLVLGSSGENMELPR